MTEGGVLVVDTGSSSVKYRVLDSVTGRRTAGGLLERTSGPGAVAAALAGEPALADARIVAVGYRIVHGGERFISPEGADVPVLVVPTDEEGEIARRTHDLVRVAVPGLWSCPGRVRGP